MSDQVMPTKTTVEDKNRRVLEYVAGRLGEKTSAGQCILHINPGGEIRKLEWKRTEHVDDVLP